MKERSAGYWIAILPIIIGLIFIGGPFYRALDNVSTERDGEITRVGPSTVGGSGRAAEYLEAIATPNKVFYAGDSEQEFHIRITESYEGEAYDGDDEGNDPFNNDNLFEATVSIQEFCDKNGKAISGTAGNPFSGFASGYGSAYNGQDNDGFTINYNQNWYATDGFDDFRLNIKSTVVPGEYTLHIIVKYNIRVDYDDVELEYISSQETEHVYIPVEVKSGLGVAHEKKVAVYDTPNGNLYAGATLQKIGVTGISSQVGDVGVIGGTLAYTGNEISIPTIYTTASLGKLDGGDTATLYWRINVKNDAAPGSYELKLSLSYTRNWEDGDDANDIRVTETSIVLKIDIDFTPLLSPPDSNELMNHLSLIDQEGETPQLSFGVTFSNGGNVDLIQIVVSLDLSAADYFYTSDFYYDEDNHAVKKDLGTEQEIASLEVGASETVTFKVGVRDTIPPGRYIIPILYDAKYFDTGVFGGSSIDVDTDENEFHNIMAARGEKEPDDKSYIYVLVEDSILDLEANTPNRLQPGMVEANLVVNLQNVDGYDLTKLNVTIPYTTDLPIKPAGGKKNFEIHFNDNLDSGWNLPFNFLVDVKVNAPLGIHDIPLRVTCRNELDEEITINVKFELDIVPVPPEIVVAMVETPVIEEEADFDLKVTLMNIGGSKASNVTALLLDNNNWFESGGTTVFKSGEFELEPSGTYTVTFKMNADKVNLENIHNSVQNLSIRVEYKDSKGNQVRFSQSPPLDVQLKTEDETNVEAATMRDWVYLILGIFALIVVVIFPLIYFRYRYKANKKERKFTRKLEERGLEDESITKPKKPGKDKKKSTKEDVVLPPPGVPAQQPRQGPTPVRDQHPQQWGASPQKNASPLPAPSGPRPPVLQHSGQVPRAPKGGQGPQYNQPLLPEHYP